MATGKGSGQDIDTPNPPLLPPAPPDPQPILTTPVYFEGKRRGKRGKKNKRYSKGTKGFQRFAYGSQWAGYRLANSFARGFKTFARRSNRSARRRRDGMVRDSLRNASVGFANAMNEFGRVPGEIAWRIGTKNVRRTIFSLNAFNPFS